MEQMFQVGQKVRDRITHQTATVIAIGGWVPPIVPGINDGAKYDIDKASLVEIRFDVPLGGGKFTVAKFSVAVEQQSLELIS